MSIYFLIFFVITIFCIFDIDDQVDKLFVFWAICVGLIFLAGFRPAEASTDYVNYLEFFREIKPGLTFYEKGSFSEPFYNFIPAFIKFLGINVIYAFLVYAILGVTFKGIAIIKLTPLIFLSLLIYYSNFFLLHEMTQIRIGVAIGLYLIGVPFIITKNIFKFSIIMLLAVCFHFSAILLWLTYFMNHNTFSRKKYITIIGIALPLTLLKLDLLSFLRFLPLGVFAEKIDFYYGAMQTGAFTTEINVFNIVTLINILVCLIFIWKIELFQARFRYSILFVKMYILSLIIFMLLSFMPPLAFRFRELFEVVQIILLPQLFFLFKEKLVGRLIVISLASLLFYMNVVHVSLVGPYFK